MTRRRDTKHPAESPTATNAAAVASPPWPTLNPPTIDDRIGRDEVEQLVCSPPTVDTTQRLQLAATQAAMKLGAAQEGKRLAQERGDSAAVGFFDEREASAAPTTTLAQQGYAKHSASVERQGHGHMGGRPRIDKQIRDAVRTMLLSEQTLTSKEVGKRLDELGLKQVPGLKDLVSDIRADIGIQRRRRYTKR
jgi:hypothetical protein